MEGVEGQAVDDTQARMDRQGRRRQEEWQAEITEQEPDKRIAWRSIERRQNAGVGDLPPPRRQHTRVTLQLDVEPEGRSRRPAMRSGFVERQAEGDLRAFKAFIEGRGTPTGAWRGEVAAGHGQDQASDDRRAARLVQGQAGAPGPPTVTPSPPRSRRWLLYHWGSGSHLPSPLHRRITDDDIEWVPSFRAVVHPSAGLHTRCHAFVMSAPRGVASPGRVLPYLRDHNEDNHKVGACDGAHLLSQRTVGSPPRAVRRLFISREQIDQARERNDREESDMTATTSRLHSKGGGNADDSGRGQDQTTTAKQMADTVAGVAGEVSARLPEAAETTRDAFRRRTDGASRIRRDPQGRRRPVLGFAGGLSSAAPRASWSWGPWSRRSSSVQSSSGRASRRADPCPGLSATALIAGARAERRTASRRP